MTIRKQVILIMGLSLVLVIGLVYFVSRLTLINDLQEIETDNIKRNVAQIGTAINHMVNELIVVNADWAAWDDTYQFIDDTNEDYIDSNLGTETFMTLKINTMLFIDITGKVVFEKAVNLNSGRETEIPQEFLSFIEDITGSPSESSKSTPIAGFILLNRVPMYISSQPILKSDDSGPSRGTLIMGRYFDSAEVSEIAEILGYPLSVVNIKDINSYPDFQKASQSIFAGNPIATQSIDDQRSAGYTFINDINNLPILLIRMEVPRDVYQSGQLSVYTLILSILGLTLLTAGLAYLMVQRTVFNRFARLIRGIDNIRQSGDIKTHLSIGGSDELSIVAGTINGMLDTLQESFAEIRTSEEKYRLITDNATDVIFTSDLELRPIYISPSIQRLAGYDVEEMELLKFTDILSSDSINIAKKALEEEFAIEQMESKELKRTRILELELICKDGTHIWIEVLVSFLRNSKDKAIGIQGVARDISERRNYLHMIQEAAEEWRTTFDSISDLISLNDIDSNIIRANEAFARIFKMRPQDLIGKNFYDIVQGLKEYGDKPQKELIEPKQPTTIEFFEPKVSRYYEATYSLVYHENGEYYATIVILRDISERKEAANELKRLYIEEQETRKQLEEEIERRIRYTRALVHELKTPITPVLVSSDILLEEVKSGPLLRIARNINEGALNLNNRVDELLDLARVEIGSLELSQEEFEPKVLLEDIYKSIIVVVEQNDQNLILDIPPILSRIFGDKERIRQVVLNLLNNAMKFTPKGGHITLRANDDGSNLIVEVQDTGQGISKKDQQTLFEPYYRSESDRARLSGLGLGLSLSKRFIELHSGKIWVKSQKGKGSTFSFSIPIKK